MIAVSGGMAASFALPASGTTDATEVKTQVPASSSALVAPSAAPAPLVSRSFGKIDFKGADNSGPGAAPVVDERTTDRVSRSSTRESAPSVSAQTRKAPVMAPARSSGGLLGVAASLAGIYYVWGGTTTAGFDCSGYTQYVFRKRGISLPRTAEAQRQATTRVSRANAQPGDLVFSGVPAHHVGIYAGNGMMWDSPRTGRPVSKRSILSSSATFGRV